MKRINRATEIIKSVRARSTWDKAIKAYSLELMENLEEFAEGGYICDTDLKDLAGLEKICLNGAKSWKQYSWGGCSLIYDYEIAERVCTPSELKQTENGERRPNKEEDWLDVQARALGQAFYQVRNAFQQVNQEEREALKKAL